MARPFVHNEQPLTTGAGLVSYMAPVDGLATPERSSRGAHRYLEAAAQAYLNGQPWHGFVSIGEPATSIVHMAQDRAVDVIAMATHGRVGLDRLVHGSVAVSVLNRTTVPVLVCRGTDAAEAGTYGDGSALYQAGEPGDGAPVASAHRVP